MTIIGYFYVKIICNSPKVLCLGDTVLTTKVRSLSVSFVYWETWGFLHLWQLIMTRGAYFFTNLIIKNWCKELNLFDRLFLFSCFSGFNNLQRGRRERYNSFYCHDTDVLGADGEKWTWNSVNWRKPLKNISRNFFIVGRS